MTDLLQPTVVAVGGPAPDLALRDDTGAEVLLSDIWSGPPRALVLVFLRHFG